MYCRVCRIQTPCLLVCLSCFNRESLNQEKVTISLMRSGEIRKQSYRLIKTRFHYAELSECEMGFGQQAKQVGVPWKLLQGAFADVRRGSRIAGSHMRQREIEALLLVQFFCDDRLRGTCDSTSKFNTVNRGFPAVAVGDRQRLLWCSPEHSNLWR